MGFLARRKARKAANDRIAAQRYRTERTSTTNSFGNGLDPASTALLYTTVVAHDTPEDRDADLSDQSDDTARDDSLDSDDNDAVDSYESESDRYSTGTDYGTSYTAPSYDFSSPSESYSPPSYDSSPSYDSGSSSSYDSGSSSSSFE